MNEKKSKPVSEECRNKFLAVKDAMELLSGKWKLQIVGALLVREKMRFMDLLRGVDGIAAKMLSKELLELEQNKLVTRTVMDTKPVTVEYELTPHGKTLQTVIQEISSWGIAHRKYLFGKQ